jgi:ribosome-associated translation inhibitor RaiA
MGDSREQISTDVTSEIIYQTFGPVPASARSEAEAMMSGLTALAPRPVLSAKVKVHDDEERHPGQRALAEAAMDVSGVILRAQTAASTAEEALRAVSERMERRVNQLTDRRQKAERRPPTSQGTWMGGDVPSRRPEFNDRPAEQRSVIRRKTYPPAERVSVSQALFDLDVLDYRFFLFTDESDDKSSIVYEEEWGVAIRKVDGSRPDEMTVRPDLRINETPAPKMSVNEAVSHLNSTDEPFAYFEDSALGQASALYRRYDGHYGLIVPSTVEAR